MFFKIFEKKKKLNPDSVLVIFFGEFPEGYKNSIKISLTNFFNSLYGSVPEDFIKYLSMQEPQFLTLENREKIFEKCVENFKEPVVLAVTRTGIWSVNPHPRFIFGSALGPGKVVFSTYRFEQDSDTPKQVNDRIGKEILKILGIACGMNICGNPDCLLTYHWDVSDLDKNVGVCAKCKKDFSTYFTANS
jgi:predicted Zn-dependent protease